MYDQTCLDNTKKAWLDIEETLQTNPTGDQALACLKRIQHLLTQCIQKDFSLHHSKDSNPNMNR
jgi:hypothetical protein